MRINIRPTTQWQLFIQSFNLKICSRVIWLLLWISSCVKWDVIKLLYYPPSRFLFYFCVYSKNISTHTEIYLLTLCNHKLYDDKLGMFKEYNIDDRLSAWLNNKTIIGFRLFDYISCWHIFLSKTACLQSIHQ